MAVSQVATKAISKVMSRTMRIAAEAYHGPGRTRPFDMDLIAPAQQPPDDGWPTLTCLGLGAWEMKQQRFFDLHKNMVLSLAA